jgi:hypothetical protein
VAIVESRSNITKAEAEIDYVLGVLSLLKERHGSTI